MPSHGDILFSSTMRGGYHRCGSTLLRIPSRMRPDGSEPRSISFHETHEWNPSLLPDGRILYTRWDYVDRNAVLYQHLWTARPDGGGVKIFYGNNTWNPCGIWEARAVPGSRKVMATAAPHHGMTAGSVILVDTLQGVDGEEPLTRLTPEVRFPESESRLPYGPTKTRDLAFDRKPTGYWAGGILDPKRQTQATTEELLPIATSRHGRFPKKPGLPPTPSIVFKANRAAISPTCLDSTFAIRSGIESFCTATPGYRPSGRFPSRAARCRLSSTRALTARWRSGI